MEYVIGASAALFAVWMVWVTRAIILGERTLENHHEVIAAIGNSLVSDEDKVQMGFHTEK